MPCEPYSPPPRFPGACPGGGWPPYRWMPVLPETFRNEVSYEGQMHWLARAVNDCWLWTSYSTNLYILQGTETVTDAQLDGLSWGDAYQGKLPADAPMPQYARCGDYVGLVQTCSDDGTECLLLLQVTGIDECRRFFDSEFRYCIRDLTSRMEDAEAAIEDLQQRMEEAEAAIEDLKDRMQAAETNISNLQTTVDQHGTAIDNLTNVLANAHGVWRAVASDDETTAQIEGHNYVTVSNGNVRADDVLLYRIGNTDFGTDSLWVGYAADGSSGGSCQFTRFVVLHDNGEYALQLRSDLDDVESSIGGGASESDVKAWIQAIVDKVYGGGTVNDGGTITWGDASPIPTGGINVFSASSDPSTGSHAAIRTHAGVSDNDLWFQ